MDTLEDFTGLLDALHDPQRLEVLARSALLDSPPEEVFDRLTHLASQVLNTQIVLVSLVDDHRQFFKSQLGVGEPWASRRGTPLSHSFCQYAVASTRPLIIADAREHPILRLNEAVRDLNVIAYLGVPLTTAQGETLGTFCTIECQPRTWTEREIKIMEDLASFVVAQIELRLLASHFHANWMKLRNLEIEREEVVQMLVHDLRNPLSSMLLSLDLMTDAPDRKMERDLVKSARHAAESLMFMVNEILDVSAAEGGQLKLALEEISAQELMDSACDLVAEMARTAGISLAVAYDGNLPTFQADKEKLRRVLVNLISNATQHTAQKGRVIVSARHDARNHRIVLSVSDNGVGIPKEAFGNIFEKFQPRIRTSTKKVSTGLGLPFCKKVVEAHGGEISIESELGTGTTFRVELPEMPSRQAAKVV